MKTVIDVFFTEAEGISSGGKAAVGIAVNGEIRAWCIGSGEDFRDAKACALRNIRTVLRKVKDMIEPPKKPRALLER